jgi:putative membrane protein
MMYGYGYGPGAGLSVWMMLAMGLFSLMILAGIVLVVVWAVRRSGTGHMGPMAGHMYGPTAGRMDPAHSIARERLAKGEITQEEYDAIMKALGT